MEFINEEVQEELGLTSEQLEALSPLYEVHIAEQKKGWDGLANENAEKILNGAAKRIYETTSIARGDGEKIADYILRVQNESFTEKEKEIQEKLKTAGADDSLKKEYEKLSNSYSELQKKEAAFDELMNSGVKDKYDSLLEANNKLNLEVSFNSVKPSFPDTVNPYEAKAKWNEFKGGVLDKYNVKIVDNEAVAIDKENEHKVVKLKDLLKKDAEISKLMEGRQQNGINAKPAKVGKIEGVPFDVPVTAQKDAKERATIIREYLSKEGVSNTSSEYSKLFTDLNNKIKEQQTA